MTAATRLAQTARAMTAAAPEHQKDITKWASATDGAFRRLPSTFRAQIAKGGPHPPEKGRYRLFISLACPWAHRTLIVRNLKGLQDTIGVTVVHWNMGQLGWRFLEDGEVADKVDRDPVMGARHIRELYFKAEPQYAGRFTVPVLWDEKLGTIVNNESSEIIRMLNDQFDEWSSKPGLSFYPETLRQKIDDVNSWIYDMLNNGRLLLLSLPESDSLPAGCSCRRLPLRLRNNSIRLRTSRPRRLHRPRPRRIHPLLQRIPRRLRIHRGRYPPLYHHRSFPKRIPRTFQMQH